jgi:hypothetical protein
MSWYTTVVFYLGVFDAVAVMLLGLAAAAITIFGWDARQMWERVLPATSILIGSTAAAAAILGIANWLIK